jgi:hypothetical protein
MAQAVHDQVTGAYWDFYVQRPCTTSGEAVARKILAGEDR